MKRIALVLGAGGVVGQAYHAGTLAAINEVTGWDPRAAELVVGTSAGSGAAALLRLGLSPSDMRHRACDEALSEEGRRLLSKAPRPEPIGMRAPAATAGQRRPSAPGLFPRALARPGRIRPGALAAAALPAGRIKVDQLGDGIRAMYGDRRWPANTTWICAVRLDEGRRVVFGQQGSPSTDIGSAVQASSAIPGFFAPVEIDGARYVDGGAHSPTNLDLVAGLGFDLVVVCSPMSAGGGPPSLRSAVRAPAGFLLARETRSVRRQGSPVLVFQPTATDLQAMGTNAMDFSRRCAVAGQAFDSARDRLGSPQVRDQVAALSDAG